MKLNAVTGMGLGVNFLIQGVSKAVGLLLGKYALSPVRPPEPGLHLLAPKASFRAASVKVDYTYRHSSLHFGG